MAKNTKKKSKFKQKLTHKYRLVVLNEDSFEERFSVKLSRLNVFVLTGVFSVLLVVVTVAVVLFSTVPTSAISTFLFHPFSRKFV